MTQGQLRTWTAAQGGQAVGRRGVSPSWNACPQSRLQRVPNFPLHCTLFTEGPREGTRKMRDNCGCTCAPVLAESERPSCRTRALSHLLGPEMPGRVPLRAALHPRREEPGAALRPRDTEGRGCHPRSPPRQPTSQPLCCARHLCPQASEARRRGWQGAIPAGGQAEGAGRAGRWRREK